MFRFATKGGARFTATARFDAFPYANVAFLDRERHGYALHISLRPEDGCISWNSWSEGAWGDEGRRPVDFGTGPATLDVRFDLLGLRILVNGKQVLRARRRFPRLNDIGWARVDGGFDPASLAVGGRVNRPAQGAVVIERISPFDIVAAGRLSAPPERVAFAVEGLDEQPATFAEDRPPHMQVPHLPAAPAMTLPGRIWELGPDITVSLRDRQSGGAYAAFTLTRAEILADIERIAARGHISRHVEEAALVLEHVRFAELYDQLSPVARAFVNRATVLFDAGRFMGQAGEARQRSLPRSYWDADLGLEDADWDAVQKARVELCQTLNLPAEPAHFAQPLAAWLDQASLSPRHTEALLWALMDIVPDGASLRHLGEHLATRGLRPAPDFPESYADLRPAMYAAIRGRAASGAYGEIAEALETLQFPPASDHEAQSLALAITLYCADQAAGVITDDKAHHLPDVCCRRFADWAPHHPHVTTRPLQEAALALLAPGVFPDPHRLGLTELLLRAFGGVTGWAARALAQGATHPGLPALAEAMEAFTQRPAADTLTPLSKGLIAGSARAAVELGVAPTGEAPDRLLGDPELILRAAARPLAEEVSAEKADVLRQIIRDRYLVTDRGPRSDAQAEASRLTAQFLDMLPRSAPEARARVTELAPLLQSLSGQDAEYLGASLALAMAQGAFAQLPPPDAEALVAPLARCLAQTAASRITGSHPALSTAHARLKALDPQDRSGLQAVLTAVTPARLPDQPQELHNAHPATPAFDTLVVVISCQPNLDTRIARMRTGWLADLTRLGVPYIVVTGNGDGTRSGDVVHLDAPDDYEGLPQKTLAAVRWVAENTAYGHLYKIDDDCHLDAEAFFHAQSHRKHDYYGRPLNRPVGGIDRIWHQAKSRTARGRLQLDRSPEPASYAEGGSGYCLSRHAMWAILEQQGTSLGQRLIRQSFMEDKTIGDLLALSNIHASSEDYFVATLRRTHDAGRPVSLWQNAVWPGPASPVKVAHLDGIEGGFDLAETMQGRARLWPPRIWPATVHPTFGFGTNTLELQSDEAGVSALARAPHAVLSTVRNERDRLPAMLDHYRRLGVSSFGIVDNCSDDGTLEYLLTQPDVVVWNSDTPFSLSQSGTASLRALLSHYRPGLWTTLADVDEFLLPPDTLQEVTARAEAEGADVIAATRFDLLSPAGLTTDLGPEPLAQATHLMADPLIHEGGEVYSRLMRTLVPGLPLSLTRARKAALVRFHPALLLGPRLTDWHARHTAQTDLAMAHLAWDQNLPARSTREAGRGEHPQGALKYRLLAASMATLSLPPLVPATTDPAFIRLSGKECS